MRKFLNKKGTFKSLNLKKQASVFLLFLALIVSPLVGKCQNFFRESSPRTKHVGMGLGPSFIMADNAGDFRNLKINVSPALSFFYGKRFHPNFSWKLTTGYQRLGSADFANASLENRWASQGSAVSFRGSAVFLDWMPQFNLISENHHFSRPNLNIHGGIGIGIFQTFNKETFKEINTNPPTYNNSNNQRSSLYLPFRGGISYHLGAFWDLGAEGSFFLTFSDELDGNTNYNRFNDFPMQLQIFVKKYLR